MSRLSARLKQAAAATAARLGVLAGATDLYFLLRHWQRPAGSVGKAAPHTDVALPPPILRLSSAGTTDVDWFLRSGAAAYRLLEELGANDGRAILDFGCGCGRVLRHVPPGDRDRHSGADWNRRAIRWCRRNLAPMRFMRCGLAPPLPDGPGLRFGLVYSFSVFTHLTEALQAPWLAELAARLDPAGVLLISTHGKSYLSDLSTEERAHFEAGELVVRQPRVAGTNVCAAYHPAEAMRRLVPPGLEIIEHRPAGALGNPTQDLWVLRRTSEALATPQAITSAS